MLPNVLEADEGPNRRQRKKKYIRFVNGTEIQPNNSKALPKF